MMPELAVNYYSRATIVRFTEAYLRALGATEEEAAIVADGLATASSRWHPGKGQGLEKLFRLTAQCENGGIQPGAPFMVAMETPAVAHVDANKGFGYVTGVRAARLAVAKAQTVGIGAVLVCHSNHYGQAGYHAEQIARSGMLAVVMTNALAEMAPWGATTPVLGTNPWGLAIPRDQEFPIVLDMALTMSGQGMIRWAWREGRTIPDTWALTRDGRRSTDPAAFLSPDGQHPSGTQLPIGEFKGYGLSLFTDVITGVLSGSLFGTRVFQDARNHDVGHFVLALNPDLFMPRSEFQERLEQLVAEVRRATPIAPDGRVYLPGELEFLREREALERGVPVDRATVERLRVLASERRVECPL
jgi:LDH2 family malate/lactate/ureidoglycolate dehydrogenase